jgi:Tfp pilus assembly PilM family ATPase/Tfp pilus assembly protein PilN
VIKEFKFKLPWKGQGLQSPVVAVEIGNDWIKVARYNPSLKGGHLTQLGFIKLVDIKGSVSDEISQYFRKTQLSKRSVVTYLPRHLVTVRMLELPSMDPAEIHSMVDLQAGKQTPYLKDEIISSSYLVGSRRPGYTRVMLAIARRKLIGERLELLQRAGIEVEQVSLGTECVFQWFCSTSLFRSFPEAHTVVVIDIDSNFSDFLVISNGQLIFSRNILIGAKHLLNDPDQLYVQFIREAVQSMTRLLDQDKELTVQRVFLTGAAEHIPQLDHLMGAEIRVPVQEVNMAEQVRVNKNVKALQEDPPHDISISPLVGAVAQSSRLQFDLTLSEQKIGKLMKERRRELTVTGVLFISIIMAASFVILIFVYHKYSYLSDITQKISAIEDGANQVEQMRDRIELIQNRLDAQNSSINILQEIYSLTPKEIYYTRVDIEEKNQAVLTGNADAMSDVFAFVTILENSPHLENVKTTYTTTKREQDREYAKFEIVCMVEEE